MPANGDEPLNETRQLPGLAYNYGALEPHIGTIHELRFGHKRPSYVKRRTRPCRGWPPPLGVSTSDQSKETSRP